MRAAPFRSCTGALLLAFAFGCATGGSAPRAEPPGSSGLQASAPELQQGSTPGALCPLAMPGVRVESEETVDGAAVRFTLRDPARLEELRAGVREMVGRQEALARAEPRGETSAEAPAHQCPVCPGMPVRMAPSWGLGPGIGTGGAGVEGVHLPPASVEVQDTADGASVVYRPEDALERDAVRDAVRRLVVQVHAGECPLPGGARD